MISEHLVFLGFMVENAEYLDWSTTTI
jgi:hypothetical protein